MLTRRDLLRAGLALGAATLIPGTRSSATSSDVVLEPFVDPLPIPQVLPPRTAVVPGAHFYEIRMQEFKQKLHRDLPPTTVWGYEGRFPGPTIEAQRNVPVFVRWVNELRDPSGALRTTHYLPVDTCLHGPDTRGSVPHTVVHLHGGRVPPESDGYPEATLVPGQRVMYHYPNAQRGTTLWYHDHALGLTRLNVYMGLAGFYLIRDPGAEGPLNLPSGEAEVPLVIQDRAFNADGSLKYPQRWQPEFLGDTVLVNGKVWPSLTVKRGKYRFRLLNGSNSRTYTLSLSSGGVLTQIGTDGGLLPAPVPLTQITLAPAERADVVIDFAGHSPGEQITLLNTHPDPPAVPVVMRFIVGPAFGHLAPVPAALGPIEILAEGAAVLTRDFDLTVAGEPCAGFRYLINGLGWKDVTEFPQLGSIEIWRIKNNIGELHPIHLHLVHFQILDHQALASSVTGARAGSAGPDLHHGHGTPPVRGTLDHPFLGLSTQNAVPVGPLLPPSASEGGWKDTFQALPGQVTRIIARFDGYTGRYPYHCHIIEHEDHEMMRQFEVVP